MTFSNQPSAANDLESRVNQLFNNQTTTRNNPNILNHNPEQILNAARLCSVFEAGGTVNFFLSQIDQPTKVKLIQLAQAKQYTFQISNIVWKILKLVELQDSDIFKPEFQALFNVLGGVTATQISEAIATIPTTSTAQTSNQNQPQPIQKPIKIEGNKSHLLTATDRQNLSIINSRADLIESVWDILGSDYQNALVGICSIGIDAPKVDKFKVILYYLKDADNQGNKLHCKYKLTNGNIFDPVRTVCDAITGAMITMAPAVNQATPSPSRQVGNNAQSTNQPNRPAQPTGIIKLPDRGQVITDLDKQIAAGLKNKAMFKMLLWSAIGTTNQKVLNAILGTTTTNQNQQIDSLLDAISSGNSKLTFKYQLTDGTQFNPLEILSPLLSARAANVNLPNNSNVPSPTPVNTPVNTPVVNVVNQPTPFSHPLNNFGLQAGESNSLAYQQLLRDSISTLFTEIQDELITIPSFTLQTSFTENNGATQVGYMINTQEFNPIYVPRPERNQNPNRRFADLRALAKLFTNQNTHLTQADLLQFEKIIFTLSQKLNHTTLHLIKTINLDDSKLRGGKSKAISFYNTNLKQKLNKILKLISKLANFAFNPNSSLNRTIWESSSNSDVGTLAQIQTVLGRLSTDIFEKQAEIESFIIANQTQIPRIGSARDFVDVYRKSMKEIEAIGTEFPDADYEYNPNSNTDITAKIPDLKLIYNPNGSVSDIVENGISAEIRSLPSFSQNIHMNRRNLHRGQKDLSNNPFDPFVSGFNIAKLGLNLMVTPDEESKLLPPTQENIDNDFKFITYLEDHTKENLENETFTLDDIIKLDKLISNNPDRVTKRKKIKPLTNKIYDAHLIKFPIREIDRLAKRLSLNIFNVLQFLDSNPNNQKGKTMLANLEKSAKRLRDALNILSNTVFDVKPNSKAATYLGIDYILGGKLDEPDYQSKIRARFTSYQTRIQTSANELSFILEKSKPYPKA